MTNDLGRYLKVPLPTVHTSPYHRRTNWGNLQALASSVSTDGIIHPLVVRPHPTVPGEWELVAGERRRRAAQIAELAEVPVIVHELDDVATIEWQARENMERENLHPLDEAEYYEELTRRGFAPGDIAKRFGRKAVDVVRGLKLLALSTIARQAYSTGEIDHDGALSLVRTLGDHPDKQNDVIAAVRSGSLQLEEVPSYCARECTAQLDDLPWRLSDAEMPGGSCVACPKRSQVQRDLFGADMVAKDRCLDVDCHRRKMDHVWQIRTAEPAYTRMDAEQTPFLFIVQNNGRPAVMRSSGMVDAEASCPLLPGYTWEEAVRNAMPKNAEPPTVYLARDQDGRPRLLYKEAIAARIVRKSDAAQEVERRETAADPSKGDESSARRAAAKVRRAIVDQIAARVVETDVDAWGWIVAQVAELVTAKSVAATLSQFSIDSSEALTEELRDASNRRRKQLALAMLVREVADADDDSRDKNTVPEALKDLCAIAGVDLAAIERAIRS